MHKSSISHFVQKFIKTIFAVSAVLLALALAGCGGGTSGGGIALTGTPLSGNWQVNLLQLQPGPATPLSVSGFFLQSEDSLAGTVSTPPSTQNGDCAGPGSLTGTVNGQNVVFSINEGGTALNFNGTVASNNQSMSGNYSGLGGGCFAAPTSGTWSALLVPPLSGNFTGTLSNSTYMQAFLGQSVVPPIAVSGNITQGTNVGQSSATLSGTINAAGYPCFSTARVTGTISGQNVILSVFAYNGEQIGSIGTGGNPATVELGPGGVSLVGDNQSGLGLNAGTCPKVSGVSSDSAQVSFIFQ
jgi:hypothetical protein